MFKLKGKFLVLKKRTIEGEEVLTLSGVSFIENKELLDSIHPKGEMWVIEMDVIDGIRLRNPIEFVSPEEFLEGKCATKDWYKEKGTF